MTVSTPTAASADAIALTPLPEVVAEIRAGRPVLVLDDAQRENEADLVCAAELVSPAVMAMMIREEINWGQIPISLARARASGPARRAGTKLESDPN